MRRETKTLDIPAANLKLDGEDRRFEGYASKFNGVDSYGDTILPGAYAATLAARERPVQLRWNHFGPVIGKIDALAEDDIGLKMAASLTPGHSVAEDAYASLKHEAVTGLSIGFHIPEGGAEKTANGTRVLKQIELVEISIVESPADLGAQIESVKAYIDGLETLSEAEALLRDAANFSRKDACAFVSRIKALALGDRVAEPDPAEIAAAIRALKVGHQ